MGTAGKVFVGMKGQRKGELILLSVSHLLVDGICAAALFGHEEISLTNALLIYNTMAFTTQCLTGMLPDRYGRGRLWVLLSAGMLACGALVPMPVLAQAVVIGLGNSLFHVSGGWLTLRGSDGMAPLGVFVAPGAIGLFLGTAFPRLRLPFTFLFAALAVLLAAAGSRSGEAEREFPPESPENHTIPERERTLLAAMLLIAVAARAVGGSVVLFPWKTGFTAGFILVLAVFLGKTCGGFLADRAGIRTAAVLSVAAASVLIVAGQNWMLPSVIGQFALNLSMPVTLYLLYRLFPDSPGFAFGLAASALWPGTLAGKLIHLTGIWAGFLAILCFLAGLAAILITERRLKQ